MTTPRFSTMLSATFLIGYLAIIWMSITPPRTSGLGLGIGIVGTALITGHLVARFDRQITK